MNLNGFPAKPKTLLSSSASANTNAGITQKEPLKFTQLCRACHALGGKGGNTGPALDGVAKKYDSQYLEKWIANPASIKPGTNMPKLPLSDTELKEIVNFLGEQK
ncbi:MAG: c-type cytochrome, partial [Leptospiraceae bacterium]|nr:c-type cytochrome [Leptospiraceae bacterium]